MTKTKFSKRILSMLLAIIMVVGMLPGFTLSASAETASSTTTPCDATDCAGTYNASGFCSADATHYQPAKQVSETHHSELNASHSGYYAIENAGQLYWFAKSVDEATIGTTTKYFAYTEVKVNAVLINDITVNTNVLDANGDLNTGTFLQWNPIGASRSRMCGIFDGNNKTVSGLVSTDTASDLYVGFVALSNAITIKDLTLDDSYILGSTWVGGIIGYTSDGGTASKRSIINCVNKATVKATSERAAGIVGGGTAVIEDCRNEGKILSAGIGGGIIGDMTYASTVKKCVNTGDIVWVSTNRNPLGGIVGRGSGTSSGDAVIENCYSLGDIIISGSNSSSNQVGGLVGSFAGSITNCYNYGDILVTGTISNWAFGNFAGYLSGTATNCYYNTTGASYGAVGDADYNGVTGKTAEEFASGEVCYLLNGSTSEGDDLVWYQTLKTHETPVFDGKVVYHDASATPQYFNEGGSDPKPTTYTVAVTASPAEGGTVTGSGTYEENASVTVTTTANDGYTFVKWTENDSAVSTDASYAFTASADRNLTAVFEAKAPATTYTVSFNANGGTGTMDDVPDVSGEYTLPANGFTAPTDKAFAGWALSADGEVITTTTVDVTENITLYAIWGEKYSLWVGGEQFNSAKLTITDANGGTATYDPDTNTLTLNNYTYEGKGYKNAAIYYGGDDGTQAKGDLIVYGIGTNQITGTGGKGIGAVGSVTVSGTMGDITGSSLGIYAEGSVTVSGTVDGDITGNDCGIFATGGVTISGTVGDITGSSQYGYGIYADSGVTFAENATVGKISGGLCGIFTNGMLTVSTPVEISGNTAAIAAYSGIGTDKVAVSEPADYVTGSFEAYGVYYTSIGTEDDYANFTPAKTVKYAVGYSVTVDDSITNGFVMADKNFAAAGVTVTVTVVPDGGYVPDTLTVKQGETPVTATKGEDGEYTFTMPAGNVTVTAVFKELTLDNAAASVTANGTTTLYADLESAVTALENASAEDNAVLKLLKDVTLYDFTVNSGVFTLDLNGKKVIDAEENGFSQFVAYSQLTIVDTAGDGVFQPYLAFNNTAKIEDGIFEGVVGAFSGTLNISGGTFKNVVTVQPDAACSITGGSFIVHPGEWVADGYGAVYNKETGYYDVVKDTGEYAVPKITSVTFNSDSSAYDADTKTFTVSTEHPLIITVKGENMTEFGPTDLLIFNSSGTCIPVAINFGKDTSYDINFNTNLVQAVFSVFEAYDLAADIVELDVAIGNSPTVSYYVVWEEKINVVLATEVEEEPYPEYPTYSGQSQALVTAGTAYSGVMQYALSNNGETAPTDGWSTDIPTATNAGTYYVWYKALGDNDESTPACVEATVEKVLLDVTADDLFAEVGDDCPTPTYTVTGFVNGETAETAGITGTPVLTYDETPDMSKEGYYFIEVNTDGMTADNYDFNPISGGLTVLEHVHVFDESGYTLGTTITENDTIFATCTKDNCPKDGKVALVQIVAPEDAVYTEGLWHTASLYGYTDQISLDSEDIVYSADPVNAGTYTASITYNGVTASVTYEVAKRPLTITADNKSVSVGGSAPEYTYTVTGWDESYDEEDGPKVSGITAVCADADLTAEGTYTITISGTPVVKDSEETDVSDNYTFTLQDGTLTVSPNTYTVSFNANGGAAIDPITVTFGEKYGKLPSSAITGLSGGDSNWYLVDESGNVTDTKISKLTVVETAGDHTLFVQRKVLAPTVKITLEVPGAISDTYQYYVPGNSTRILTATVSNRNDEVLDYSYQWYKDGTPIDGATDAVLRLDGNVSDGGTYKVAVTASLKDNVGITVTESVAVGEKAQNVKILHAANTLSYDANGGENAPGSHYTGGVTITVSSNQPSRVYHTFAGWNTKADGSGDSYSGGDTFTFADDNGNGGCEVTLYVQWTADTYSVTLVTNGGTVRDGNVTEYTYGIGATLPTNVKRSGYSFDGWYDNEACTGTPVTEITASDTGAKTFYAKWTRVYVSSNTSTTTTYPPTVDSGDNGDVTVTPAKPEKGDTVTVTPAPDTGYEVDEIIVTDKNGDPVTVTDKGDGTYSFKQPTGKVNIKVTFKATVKVCPRDNTCPMYGYTDLDRSEWYHDGVHYCLDNGLMVGCSDDLFMPGAETTRAMFVTMLWRFEGSPVVNYLMRFEDVDQDTWYAEAIRWAASEGIVQGYDATTFAPDDSITREQMATMLYRYIQKNGGGFTGMWMFLLDYTDRAEISDWAYESVCYMTMHGLMQGKDNKVFDPSSNATRAEVATLFQRYCVNLEK